YPSMEALLAALARPPARRRVWLLAGAAAAALGASAWLSLQGAGGACGGDGEVAGVGSEAHAERVTAAFVATERPYAAAAAERVAAALDRYAGALREARARACERAQADGGDALAVRRAACLDRRLRRLAVHVRALQRPDAALVDRADALVFALPEVAPCL